MVVVGGEVIVAPGDAEAAKAAMVVMGRASRAEAGCVTYRFYADLEEPGRFCVFEIWESGAALQAHFEAPHMATFRATLAKLTIVSRNVVRYEVAGAEKL